MGPGRRPHARGPLALSERARLLHNILMQRSLSLITALLFSACPAFAGVVAAPALPASAVTAAFGASIGAQIGRTIDGISLRSTALTLSSLDALRSSYPEIKDPQQRAAATAVLAALSIEPAALPQRLARTDLPAAAAARITKVAEHLAAATAKDPAAAARIETGRKADAALVQQALEHPERVLPANLVATFRAFLDWSKAGDTASVPATPGPEPVVATPEQDWSKVDPKILLDPASRPRVSFGVVNLPVLAQPTLGDDIAKLWTSAHDQSRSAIIAAYNFDDMDIAASIVAKSKTGRKQVIVGDYSNWFPDQMPQSTHGGKTADRTEAMKLILSNLGPNLELHILKGLGSIGINHNKFTVYTAPDATELLQSGSFNYTKTSQNNHWENVVFTDDAGRLAFYKTYFAWLVRRSRPYSPDLKPADPIMDPADPIPQDESRVLAFHGVPFPKASGSPNGGTEDWLVKAEQLVEKQLDILMFSPFPTPAMVAAMEVLLAKGISVRMIADRGQVSRAGLLVPLIDKGMKLKVIVGPDVVLRHEPYGEHSKQHEKVMIFDGATPGALAKMGDSLNISRNALDHNFENTAFWQGFHAAFMQAHFNMLWDLATEPTKEMLDKLGAENDQKMASEDRTSPWEGEPKKG